MVRGIATTSLKISYVNVMFALYTLAMVAAWSRKALHTASVRGALGPLKTLHECILDFINGRELHA